MRKHITDIKKLLALKKLILPVAIIGMLMAILVSPAYSQNFTQGYSTDKVLQRGTVVSLDEQDTSKVVPANKGNEERIHGIVVAPNDATITISDVQEKTFVATIGRFDGLVSTERGVIEPGDFLTVSSVSGIATKAGDTDRFTVGKAIEGFDGSGAISNTQLQNSLGETQNIAIGRILVDISVTSNPLLRPAESNLPEFLEKATRQIAGKEVSAVRVYISIFILLISGAVSGSLLYSGIKSSIISVGRNPLSKNSITKSLIQIILTAIIIVLIGIFGVYLLLRL